MSKVISDGKFLAVSGEKVYVFNLNDHNYYVTIDFNANFNPPSTVQHVDCLQISNNGDYIAICVQKLLMIYKLADGSLHSSISIEKTATSIKFFNKSSKIIISDRSGSVHCYKYDSLTIEKEQLTFGHNSLLTDVIITPNDDFIITADRDEKIRVTNYPNVYNIENFCLGHDQFISNLFLLSHNPEVLVSASGDGTIRLWNYCKGAQLSVFSDGKPIEKAVCFPYKDESLIAMQRHNDNVILLLNVKGSAVTGFDIQVKSQVDVLKTVIDLCPLQSSLICLIDSSNILKEVWNSGSNDDFLLKVNNRLGSIKIHKATEAFEILFKKEFDNLQEYHERKKARLSK